MNIPQLARLLASDLREPSAWSSSYDAATGEGTATWTFDPPLTMTEQDILDNHILPFVRANLPGITLAEWDAIQPDLATIRQALTTTEAEFMAMTAANRDLALFRAVQSTLRVLRAMLRDT